MYHSNFNNIPNGEFRVQSFCPQNSRAYRRFVTYDLLAILCTDPIASSHWAQNTLLRLFKMQLVSIQLTKKMLKKYKAKGKRAPNFLWFYVVCSLVPQTKETGISISSSAGNCHYSLGNVTYLLFHVECDLIQFLNIFCTYFSKGRLIEFGVE